MVMVVMVVVVVGQAGRTGLFDGHSTTGFPIVPAAVSSARPTAPPDVGCDCPRSRQEAYATRHQVAHYRHRHGPDRSPRTLTHSK
jgi:hypothetical protein